MRPDVDVDADIDVNANGVKIKRHLRSKNFLWNRVEKFTWNPFQQNDFTVILPDKEDHY